VEGFQGERDGRGVPPPVGVEIKVNGECGGVPPIEIKVNKGGGGVSPPAGIEIVVNGSSRGVPAPVGVEIQVNREGHRNRREWGW
jgi:hypothetical protein